MNRLLFSLGFAMAGAALLWGCATAPKITPGQQTGESLVFIGEEPSFLAWRPLPGSPLRVRSTYLPGSNTIQYVEGRDYTANYFDGTLRRVTGSRIPDFRTNMLYGQEAFDHAKFPGFGNNSFFVFVDYTCAAHPTWPVQEPQTNLLKQTQAKLKNGQTVKIVAFGDSITAGGDVSDPEMFYWMRWTEHLRQRYPKARITTVNGATGGDNTAQGLERLQTKVLDQHPDLVLVAFGMNDHNVLPFGVLLPQFEQNLKTMIDGIRQKTSAEVILLSAFPPNPKWKYGSQRMADYAAATERVARETACAYADVFNNWQTIAARKRPEDLLANDINHPNEFGHWMYFQVLCHLGL